MKTLIFNILICLFLTAAMNCARCQTVSNVSVQQEGNNIVVSYVLDGDSNDVQLTVSTDGGKTFSGPLKCVSGDVGSVSSGHRKIVWDVLSEYNSFAGDDVVFDVTAEPFYPKKNIVSDYNGHMYVDLGLSVKWATCNIGATSPEEKGGFFASGSTGQEYAQTFWGGTWRVPTSQEWKELQTKCKWIWTTCKGHKGYKIISLVKGYERNWIFLRADGYMDGRSVSRAGSNGYYWTSSIMPATHNSVSVRFNDGNIRQVEEINYGFKFSIRPVSD